MKNLIIIIILTCWIIFGFIPGAHKISSIYGTIEPAEAAKKVLAISGKDTVTVVPEAGKFSIAVTTGTWMIVVEAEKPYKDAVIENIKVEEGKSADAGVIRLLK